MAKKKITLAKLDIDTDKLIKAAKKSKEAIEELKEELINLQYAGQGASQQFQSNYEDLKELTKAFEEQIKTIKQQIEKNEDLADSQKTIKKELQNTIEANKNLANSYTSVATSSASALQELDNAAIDALHTIATLNSGLTENKNLMAQSGESTKTNAKTFDEYKTQVADSFNQINLFNGGIGGLISRAEEAGGAGPLLKTAFTGDVFGITITQVIRVANTATNLPSNQNGVLVSYYRSSVYGSLIFYADNGETWYNTKNGAPFGVWKRIWSNSDFTTADIIKWNTAYNRGDFKNYGIGIGASGDGKVFPGTDANDTNVLNGIYSVGTGIVANLPGSNSGTLIVERYTNYITQKFQAINSGDVVKMYIRHYKPASTSWTPWREIWTNENLTPTDLTNWNQAYNNYVPNTYLNPRSSVTFNGDVNELPKGTYTAGMSSLSTNKPFSAVGGLLSVGSTGQLGFQLLGARAGNDLWFRPWATAYENWYKLWNSGDFTSTDISNWNSKQAALVSGTNIKTIEGQSLLGSGNIDLSKADVGLSNVDNTSDVNKPISTATQTVLNTKQTTLVSGTNIKTVGGQSLLGSGNLTEVQNNLNASTILAPSVNAVNTALITKANEADVLHKNGDETKNGNLTITGNVSGAGATQLNHLVTLGQVNGKINDAFNSRIIFDSTYSGSSSWFSSLNTLYPDASPGLIVYAYSMPGSAGAFAMCVKLPEENVWGICAGSGTVE